MKIAWINGSPKPKRSISGYLLENLQTMMAKENTNVPCAPIKDSAENMGKALISCDALVFAFPLYVDGIPSHLLRFLQELEPILKTASSKAKVYACINCGFYEGDQTKTAMRMLKVWCEKAGLVWGGGMGIGCGPMAAAAPLGKGPAKNLEKAFRQLSAYIQEGKTADDTTTEPNFPRFLYILSAHSGWKSAAKKRGLKSADLYRKVNPSLVFQVSEDAVLSDNKA